jgi:hypothetical protein
VSDKETPNRADIVRQRRKQDEIRRSKRPAPRASAPTSTLPRRGVTLDASTRRAQPKAKPAVRKYDSVAAAPLTAQLQTPALTLPRFRASWRLLSFFLVALLGAGIYLAWTLPMFRVPAATVVGNKMLTAGEIETVLHLNNTQVFLVNPSMVADELRSHFPEIISAKVSVDLPNLVTVEIVERQPVIRWEQSGTYAWMDPQGVLFLPRGDMPGLVVVSASGFPPGVPKSKDDPDALVPFAAPQIIESVRQLAPHVPQGSVLLYDPKYGFGWVDGRGWTVWFGANPDQTDMKLRVYAALVDSILQRGILPSFINVAYPSAPYYRVGQ